MSNFLRNKDDRSMRNDMIRFGIQQLGFGPVGEVRILLPSSGNSYNYFRHVFEDAETHTKISKAEEAMVSNRNDVTLVAPQSHVWYGDSHVAGAALTWDKTNCHLVGMSPSLAKAGYLRSRFDHTGYTCANMMTVSGAENVFANLRFIHGSSTGGASDVRCMTISGAGNVFKNVNFATPIDTTQGASANYRGVKVSGSSNYFKDCMFGTANAVAQSGTGSSILELQAGQLNVFEDCIFRTASLTATDNFFILWNATAEAAGFTALFLNCQFVNYKAAASSNRQYAISDASTHANNLLYFDSRCAFFGCDDVIASGSASKIKFGAPGSDGAAVGDRLYLGLAVSPAVS